MQINYMVICIMVVAGYCFPEILASEKNDKVEVKSLKQLQSLFMNPPIEYRSAPLWVWNDKVSEKQIDQQLSDFKKGGLGGVFIHPRPGLITSYLSEEWFQLCAYTVKKGKELGMKVWLYDENSYPSGFAGGHVPAEMPESFSHGQGLVLTRTENLPEELEPYYLILKLEGKKFLDITNNFEYEKNRKGDYFLYTKSYYENLPWHGGYSYVDLLHEGVTEKFIELTMNGYEKHFGNEFGNTVPGIFTDEPNISSPGGIRWTSSLFSEFEKRWGYDLKTNLPSLEYELGDWKRVRHNYYTTLLEMFIERWSKPWYNYTKENNLDWTGHYWEHGWPNPNHGSDNMAMYAWHQIPAIDILMNQYSEEVNAQFGNVRAVKELSSVANQMGKTRTLSETYGAGGWDLSFEDMKRIGDWEYVLGVNFMNQHLSYMTLEGARKRDHPQSFSYHEPWWKYYNKLGDYFARLSLALSSGKQINRVLVFEPTTTAWMYFSETQANDKIYELGPMFQEFIMNLEKHQIEYDLASESIVKNIGKIEDNEFIVGERTYDVIIFPPGMKNLDKSTYELVKSYLREGGNVLSFNNVLRFIDGIESSELKETIKKYSEQWINVKALSEKKIIDMVGSNNIQFINADEIKGKLFHHRRELNDGQLLFLVNSSSDEWSTGSLLVKGNSISELNLMNGETLPYKYIRNNSSLKIFFELPPSGSILLLVSDLASKLELEESVEKAKIVVTEDVLRVNMNSPNTLTLDYCDIKLGEFVENDVYFYEASDKIFKHHGFEGNPWNRAVQYKTSITDRNSFSENSGFEAGYQFLIDDGVDIQSLQAVVERPELWQIFINDKNVKSDLSSHWLDRKFGVYDIGKHVIYGNNILKVIASPMSIYSEIEPIYILGNFALEPQEKGWKLVKDRTLELGSWKEQGLPFYSNMVSYSKNYFTELGDKRYIVKLLNWKGSVANVKVNNKSVGIIGWSPYELDITEYLSDGVNEISIEVSGSLKNLLGPHHIGPVRGTAWPASFESAPENLPSGDDYDFIDYGLFDDFVLLESEGLPKKLYWKIEHVSKPIFETEETFSFSSPIYVSLSTPTDGAQIHYTLDGSEPDEYSNVFSKPIKLENSTVIKTKSFKLDSVPSSIVQRDFYILDEIENGLEYSYYEGDWLKLPDFKSLKAIKNGHVYAFNLDSFKRRSAKFAIEFAGYFQIEAAGEYSFYTVSNDGSKLYIGNQLVVNNDGIHGSFEGQGKINLKQGIYPIKLQYFDAGGSQSLKVLFSKEGGKRENIPLDKLTYRNEKKEN